MKRILLSISGGFILLCLVAFIILKTWIGRDVKANIEHAKEKYPGTAEDALIAYLVDENNSPGDRTRVAVWTLGQIQSEKALPVLRDLYENDPRGETCYGRHGSVLCQYEIHKAVKAIENFRIFTYSRYK